MQVTRLWFKAREQHLQNHRGGSVEHIEGMGRGCVCRSGMHSGRGGLEMQEGWM